MKKRFFTALILGAAFVLGAHGAMAAAKAAVATTARDVYPAEVEKKIQEFTVACKVAGGMPKMDVPNRHSLVEHGILKGGLEVWAIDQGRFACTAAKKPLLGSDGAQVFVFGLAGHKQIRLMFQQLSSGLKMQKDKDASALWVKVSGELCVADGAPVPAAPITCERQLIWDNKAKTLDFAPIAEARAIH